MENGKESQRLIMPDRPLSILIMNRKYDNVIGGVERISIMLANEMAIKGHKCHIVSLDVPGANARFDINQNVVWHKISKILADHRAGFFERLRRLLLIHRILKKYKIDVAIGFQDGAYLSLLVAAFFTGVPVIAAERNAPSRFDYLKNKNMRSFVFNTFRLAKVITVQCHSYIEQYPSYLRAKITVIPNPVISANTYANPVLPINGRKKILFVGRLDYQKNLATLFESFSLLAKDYLSWDLQIVGDGQDRIKLEKMCKSLSLEGRILFAGSQTCVSEYYTSSHIFCLPSLWEGFPNSLAEAMSHGLPACGFEQCGGVRDLIEDGKTGILALGNCYDAVSLASSLKKLMDDPELCQNMGLAGLEKTKLYAPHFVFEQWERTFQDITAKP